MRRRALWLIWPLWFVLTTAAGADAPADCPPLPVPIDAAAPAQNHGMLWRLRRGGADSFLFASLHLGRPAWALPGPALREAWAQTDLLAVELDVHDGATQRALATAPLPIRPLSAALQRRLAAQVQAACLPPQALVGLHPLLQVSTLTLLAARWDGLDAAFGQEEALLALARAQGRKVLALETAQAQLQALITPDEREAARHVAQALGQLERGEVRAPMLRLANAWARGDMAELQSYERWCGCVQTESDRRWLRSLNDGRNPAMAARIKALHDGGAQALVAVGALHMTGPQALPALLVRLGFELERIH